MDKPYFGANLLRTRLVLPDLAECVGLPKGLPSAQFFKLGTLKRGKEEGREGQ